MESDDDDDIWQVCTGVARILHLRELGRIDTGIFHEGAEPQGVDTEDPQLVPVPTEAEAKRQNWGTVFNVLR